MYHATKRLPSPQWLQEQFGVKFWVYHAHNGNDPKRRLRDAYANVKNPHPSYVTQCLITSKKDKADIQAVGVASCSPNDPPSRRRGHEIAVARAIKVFMQRTEVKQKLKEIEEQNEQPATTEAPSQDN